MKFIWDDDKSESNIKKHGISFEEVLPMLEGNDVTITYDDAHSTLDEPRFLMVGPVKPHGIVVVVATETEGSVTRIISAWKKKGK